MIDAFSQNGRRDKDRRLSAIQLRHRIEAATGYLMLGMVSQARREIQPLDGCDSLEVLRLRGEILREGERHNEAIIQFEKVLEVDSKDLSAYIGIAWCHKRLDRLNDAIDTLRAAALVHPREAIIQYNLACYFALADDKERCLSHLGISLRLDANYVELIDEESDFDKIRNDADFRSLVDTLVRVA